MSKSELKANMAFAHLVGHIQFYLNMAIDRNDQHQIRMHLKALIRACELNESEELFQTWKNDYENQLKNYE